METKDLYAEALLIKVKNEIKAVLLSKLEIIKYLDEAREIAEEISCPEVLWKIYFEYGRFLQDDKQYLRALEYYQRCHDIFGDVGGKIKNESYQNSYLDRPDRQAVFTAIDEIKELARSY
jgi:tetratricopeptide (TPR) repeat protein